MPTPSARVRVKLKDIKPNPFRSFEVYPLNEDRIQRLITSIKETGFWDNIIGRKKENKVEIAYGHHRVEALKRIYPETKQIEIMVRNFSDEEMLRIMGGENDEAYSCLPGAVDDTVKSARDFLKGNPDLARKILASGYPEAKRAKVGAPMITEFLGKNWTKNKVETSLERINLVESGEVDSEAIYKFPTMASADRFAKVVRDLGIKVENQRVVAEEIIKQNRLGERSQYDIAMTMGWQPRPGGARDTDADYCDEKLRKATKGINKAIKEMQAFGHRFRDAVILGGRTTAADICPDTLDKFNRSVNRLSEQVKKVGELLKEKK
jgi:hypothetical protein